MKKFVKTIFAAAVLFCAASLFAESAVKVEFKTKDIYGKNVTSAVFEDADVTMINIWGTFCGPCIREMPDLGKLNAANAKNNFQVLGIVIDSVNRKGQPVPKTVETAKTIVSQTGADYLHIIPDTMLLNGVLKDVFAVPTTIFVDSRGNQIGQVYTGSRSLEEWQKIVDEVLKSVKK